MKSKTHEGPETIKNISKISILLISFCLLSIFSKATHNRAGEILYKRIAPFTQVVNGNTVQVYTYSITIIKYTDDGQGIADRCVDTVYFGDNTRGVAPRVNGPTTCNFCSSSIGCGQLILSASGYKMKLNIYTIIHTYPGSGSYLIRSSDPNRNQNIHNIPGSVNIPFYIESKIIINSNLGNNSSPIISNPPTDHGFFDSCMSINFCAYDPDGDSLSYELTTCRGGDGLTVPGYFFPETGANGTFSINPATGVLTWCSPQFVGQYNVAIIVKEWRKQDCNGAYALLGYVMRDLQILTGGSSSAAFSDSAISDTCVKAGTSVLKTSYMIYASGISTDVYGETSSFATSPATASIAYPGGTTAVTYSWQTQCSQVRAKPYEVNLVYTDIFTFQKFVRTFKVKVLPPSPTIYGLTADTGVVTLNWQSLSSCLPNLAGYNIYRKVSPGVWSPTSCQQGVTPSSGFVLVGSVPSNSVYFTDMIYHPILNGTQVQYIVTAYTNDCMEGVADNAHSIYVLVGIKENKLSSNAKVYPNPFKNNLQIYLDKPYQYLESSLYSSDGKLVFHIQNDKVQGVIQLSLKDLESGLYLLKLKTDNGVLYQKVIRE